MKIEVGKDVKYFLALPYGISLRRDDEGDWVAKVDELPGCTAHGAERAEALENLEEVQRAWIEDAIAAGSPIPEPDAAEGLPSGKWLQRVPRSLHKKLTELAKKEGVSLNQLATSVLAEAVGSRHEQSISAAHSPTAELIWVNMSPQGSFAPEWKLPQPKDIDLDLIDTLTATASTLPNEIFEFDFKATEDYARKKAHAHKA